MIEVTDEMRAAVRAAVRAVLDQPFTSDGDVVAAVLAIVERDQWPTPDAYYAAVRALEKHRQRADRAEAELATRADVGVCCVGYAPCQRRPGCNAVDPP